MAKPDPWAFRDEYWAAWCGKLELLEDLDDAGMIPDDDDFDGDRLAAPPVAPAEEAASAELTALLAEWADRQRAEQFRRAFEAGDTELALAAVHPDVLSDPERLAQVIELARRLLPEPEPAEREFVPPVYAPDHVLAGHNAPDGYVSHGPQFTGSSGPTPLERLDQLFTVKGRLLTLMAKWESEGGNVAGAMSWQWNARMREVQAEIDSLGRLLKIDSWQLHQMDLRYESAARRALRAAERAREPAPARGAAVARHDFLGRPVPPQGAQFHPLEAGQLALIASRRRPGRSGTAADAVVTVRLRSSGHGRPGKPVSCQARVTIAGQTGGLAGLEGQSAREPETRWVPGPSDRAPWASGR